MNIFFTSFYLAANDRFYCKTLKQVQGDVLNEYYSQYNSRHAELVSASLSLPRYVHSKNWVDSQNDKPTPSQEQKPPIPCHSERSKESV